MGDKTGIEWTEATWNPVTGCTKVSQGCKHCYAETMAKRLKLMGNPNYANGFAVTLQPQMLGLPLTWKKPRRVFVNSMSDLFHENVPDEYILDVFTVMAIARQHCFQLLTKRPARMREFLNCPPLLEDIYANWYTFDGGSREVMDWPLPNVWLGVSCEDQRAADERIPELRATPAAVRFLSCEPLLGPISLFEEVSGVLRGPAVNVSGGMTPSTPYGHAEGYDSSSPGVDWVIVGGESGPGARPMNLDWARDIVQQCQDAGVACFVKQLGAVWARGDGADPKGGDMSRWPDDLKVRQFPEAAE